MPISERETQVGRAWAPLFAGLDELAPEVVRRLSNCWPGGISINSAAPAEVLVRLVGKVFGYFWGAIPAEVVDAAIAHPSPRVRRFLGEYCHTLTADQWARLISSDPPGGVLRSRLIHYARWRFLDVDVTDFERWAVDPDPQVRIRVLWFPRALSHLVRTLATDPDPAVRTEICVHAWQRLAAEQWAMLLADPDRQVREAAWKRHDLERPMLREEFDALPSAEQLGAALRQNLTRDLAESLVRHEDVSFRRQVAGNTHIAVDLIAVLAEDEDGRVRTVCSTRPDIDEAQRAEIVAGLDPTARPSRLLWVEDLHGDDEAMRRLARSASAGIRYSVAHARRLPADVAHLLSRDPVDSVRFASVTAFREHASADDLLDFALRNRSRAPLIDPRFPREGLRRFADDPDPWRRSLALEDPDAPADLVEYLATDPFDEVRGRAAADPRLSPDTVVRLLNVSHRTGKAAIVNPKLPTPILIRLLLDPKTAQDAATNPAIPVPVMHRMIDAADLDR